MNDRWWVDFWTLIDHWAFLLVIVFLAIELLAIRFREAPQKRLDDAKDLAIAKANEGARQAQLQAISIQQHLHDREWDFRSYNTPQIEQIERDMQRFGSLRADVVICGASPESKRAAEQLGRMLYHATWAVRVIPAVGSGRGTGIVIFPQSGPDTREGKAAARLCALLLGCKTFMSGTPFEVNLYFPKNPFPTGPPLKPGESPKPIRIQVNDTALF
jgi:hypothetical protein